MSDAAKRYLVVIQFKGDTRLSELAKRVPSLQDLISAFSKGEMEQVFRSPEGLSFGMFFKSASPDYHMRSELNRMTINGDSFLLCEVGNLTANKGLGRPATWLQRH